jgi:hypothetical protein
MTEPAHAPAGRSVAVAATADWRGVAGHAGRVRQWLVFAIDAHCAAEEVRRVELSPEQIFHLHKEGPHPLDGVEAVIAASAGEGFVAHLKKLGIVVALTAEADPRKAASDYAASELAAPRSRGLAALLCKVRDAFSPHR